MNWLDLDNLYTLFASAKPDYFQCLAEINKFFEQVNPPTSEFYCLKHGEFAARLQDTVMYPDNNRQEYYLQMTLEGGQYFNCFVEHYDLNGVSTVVFSINCEFIYNARSGLFGFTNINCTRSGDLINRNLSLGYSNLQFENLKLGYPLKHAIRYLDFDNNIISDDLITSFYGFGCVFKLCNLKNQYLRRLYNSDIDKGTLNFSINLSLQDGSVVSSATNELTYKDCILPQFMSITQADCQFTNYFYLPDTDLEDNNNFDFTLSNITPCVFDIDCDDCSQYEEIIKNLMQALNFVANHINNIDKNESDEDMPDYTQILTNINTNLANIHSDLHATVLDENDNPVDMNVPQALVEVNNSIQADSDKPIIVGNEDVSPWSAV